MSLRSFLDDIAPSFEKGGKFEALYPAYGHRYRLVYTIEHHGRGITRS